MKKITAFILAYNCGTMLAKAFDKIPKDLVEHIIISDDGSTDDTVDIVKNIPAIYYRNSTNLGYGGNIKESLKRCFENGADYAVEIHGD